MYTTHLSCPTQHQYNFTHTHGHVSLSLSHTRTHNSPLRLSTPTHTHTLTHTHTHTHIQTQFQVVPIRDIRTISIAWPMPEVKSKYRSKPYSIVSHLVGHEGQGVCVCERERGRRGRVYV